jgi:hypothetical protein
VNASNRLYGAGAHECQTTPGGAPVAGSGSVFSSQRKRALSIPAFISCVDDALKEHPLQEVRRAAAREMEVLEREIGFDLKVVKGAVRRGSRQGEEVAEMLHAQLRPARALGEPHGGLLRRVPASEPLPGEPLAIVGSALVEPEVGNVSLLLTGSIREYLETMLNNSREPLFNCPR